MMEARGINHRNSKIKNGGTNDPSKVKMESLRPIIKYSIMEIQMIPLRSKRKQFKP